MSFKGIKKFRVGVLRGTLFASALWIIFILPVFSPIKSSGENMFKVSLNGVYVGTLSSEQAAKKCLREARRQFASGSEELLLADSELTTEGAEVFFGEVDTRKTVRTNMLEVLRNSKRETLERSYTVKINTFFVNVSSKDDVYNILETALSKYDTDNKYSVQLVADPTREVNVLTSEVETTEDVLAEEAEVKLPEAGIDLAITNIFDEIEPLINDRSFEDYEIGLMDIDFGDKIEVVESYLPSSEITDVNTAIDMVTKDQETNQIYEVKSGDTLGLIAENYGLTLDELVAMNPTIETAESMIRIGDEIIVTVPEPELAVVYIKQEYFATSSSSVRP